MLDVGPKLCNSSLCMPDMEESMGSIHAADGTANGARKDQFTPWCESKGTGNCHAASHASFPQVIAKNLPPRRGCNFTTTSPNRA
jgi:hypothetical protein